MTGERFGAKEIEFDEAQPLDLLHGDTRRHHFLVGPFEKRKVIHQGPVGDDHPGGVGGGMPRESFEGARAMGRGVFSCRGLPTARSFYSFRFLLHGP